MKRREDENIQHLLGGYASGTLTPEEQQRLFEAAMDDQELFDALANEQALKEILDDPESRGYLRKALAEVPQKSSKLAWWWPAAGLSTIAAGIAVFLLVSVQQKTVSVVPETQVAQTEVSKEMAQNKDAVPRPVPAPQPARKFEQPQPKRDEPVEIAAAPAPPVVAEAEAKEAPKTSAPAVFASAPPPPPPASSAQSASILFLQPRAFGVAGGVAPGAAMASRTRAATASAPAPERQAKKAADTADKAESLTVAAGPVANAGIRYRIFRRNSQGEFVETRLDTRFEDGDEIQLLVEANAPGTLSLLLRNAQGWRPLPQGAMAANGLRSETIRLERGAMELGLILQSPSVGGMLDVSGGPRPVVNQLTEVRGNAMYVVAPGLTQGLVATTVRITVH